MDVNELIGKTLTKIERIGDDELIFFCDTSEAYHMNHDQVCCENVIIDDICGDLDDLIGSKILLAEEASNNGDLSGAEDPYSNLSHTWTFYKFATIKGYVTIRWYGSSNGYYSESVSFERIRDKRD